MFASLRARLFFSYLLVIGLTLCIAACALLFILIDNPLPTRQTYQQLASVALSSRAALRGGSVEQANEALSEIAEANQIRILRVAPDSTVLFDSAGQVPRGNPIPLGISPESSSPEQRGVYVDPSGREWLYIAIRPPSNLPAIGTVVFASRRPRAPIFRFFGENLLGPLIQAAVIGLCASAFLAILISNSVVRPLRRTARAVTAIASGDYEHQTPEAGPSEVRDLARSFNRMAEKVQHTQKMQRDFLANVSHELKTPLTSIQGFAQAILDGAAAQPAFAAKVIYEEAGRMGRLVEDLLDLARIESGQAPFRREHVPLTELVRSVIDHLTLRAAEQHISLEQVVNPLPNITGDNDRLAQVFTNLMDNAITHTPPGGQILVRAAPANGGIEISVRDTGKGIPPEDLSRIFERFYQVDKSRARAGRQGTGLGLTISKEIVEAHGGTIRAESSEGKGTTFLVWLPLPRPGDETVPRLS